LPQALTQLFSFPNGLLTDTISTLSIATAAVVLVVLLIKVRQNHARTSQFLLTNLLISLPLCAIFNPFGELRYFTSAFIFMLLAIASFTPLVNSKLASTQLSLKLLWGNTPIIILTILLVIFLGGTLALSQNYNYSGTGKITYEEIAYRDTIDYLKQLRANKIWASPIIPALDPELITTSKFDTFGYMFVIGTPVETLIKEQLADGVDYIVVDAFGSMLAITQPQMREFMQQVEQQGTLIKIITPENFTVLGERIYSFSNP